MFINNFRWINLELAARPVTKNVLTSVFSSLCVTTNNTAAVHTCNCILVHFIIKLINSLKRLNDLCFVLYQSIKRNVFYLFDWCDKKKLFSNSSYLTKNKHVFSFTFPHVSFYIRQDCCLGRERTFSFFHKISKRFFFTFRHRHYRANGTRIDVSRRLITPLNVKLLICFSTRFDGRTSIFLTRVKQ